MMCLWTGLSLLLQPIVNMQVFSKTHLKVLILLLFRSAYGWITISMDPSPVTSAQGSDVLLTCTFTVDDSLVDLKFLSVKWFFNGERLVEYNPHENYIHPRVKVFVEEFHKGNTSLLLMDVKVANGGVYICDILYTPDTESKEVQLEVTAPPKVSVSDQEAVKDKEATLKCFVSGFYPESITVSWLQDGQLLKSCHIPRADKAADGTFRADSILSITPTDRNVNAAFTCRVEHMTLLQPLQQDFKLILVALYSDSEQKIQMEDNGEKTSTPEECRNLTVAEGKKRFENPGAPQGGQPFKNKNKKKAARPKVKGSQPTGDSNSPVKDQSSSAPVTVDQGGKTPGEHQSGNTPVTAGQDGKTPGEHQSVNTPVTADQSGKTPGENQSGNIQVTADQGGKTAGEDQSGSTLVIADEVGKTTGEDQSVNTPVTVDQGGKTPGEDQSGNTPVTADQGGKTPGEEQSGSIPVKADQSGNTPVTADQGDKTPGEDHSDGWITISMDPSLVTSAQGSDMLLTCTFTVDDSLVDLKFLSVKRFFNGEILAEHNPHENYIHP
nr:PREDICTED: uncharacterized protein LOC106706388 [Latimeria chalumnae]|eukprot:XP_014352759.1 PREDICTED: uncharacterized protein LOC106706388 [Latimeria chalumnae]